MICGPMMPSPPHGPQFRHELKYAAVSVPDDCVDRIANAGARRALDRSGKDHRRGPEMGGPSFPAIPSRLQSFESKVCLPTDLQKSVGIPPGDPHRTVLPPSLLPNWSLPEC